MIGEKGEMVKERLKAGGCRENGDRKKKSFIVSSFSPFPLFAVSPFGTVE